MSDKIIDTIVSNIVETVNSTKGQNIKITNEDYFKTECYKQAVLNSLVSEYKSKPLSYNIVSKEWLNKKNKNKNLLVYTYNEKDNILLNIRRMFGEVESRYILGYKPRNLSNDNYYLFNDVIPLNNAIDDKYYYVNVEYYKGFFFEDEINNALKRENVEEFKPIIKIMPILAKHWRHYKKYITQPNKFLSYLVKFTKSYDLTKYNAIFDNFFQNEDRQINNFDTISLKEELKNKKNIFYFLLAYYSEELTIPSGRLTKNTPDELNQMFTTLSHNTDFLDFDFKNIKTKDYDFKNRIEETVVIDAKNKKSTYDMKLIEVLRRDLKTRLLNKSENKSIVSLLGKGRMGGGKNNSSILDKLMENSLEMEIDTKGFILPEFLKTDYINYKNMSNDEFWDLMLGEISIPSDIKNETKYEYISDLKNSMIENNANIINAKFNDIVYKTFYIENKKDDRNEKYLRYQPYIIYTNMINHIIKKVMDSNLDKTRIDDILYSLSILSILENDTLSAYLDIDKQQFRMINKYSDSLIKNINVNKKDSIAEILKNYNEILLDLLGVEEKGGNLEKKEITILPKNVFSEINVFRYFYIFDILSHLKMGNSMRSPFYESVLEENNLKTDTKENYINRFWDGIEFQNFIKNDNLYQISVLFEVMFIQNKIMNNKIMNNKIYPRIVFKKDDDSEEPIRVCFLPKMLDKDILLADLANKISDEMNKVTGNNISFIKFLNLFNKIIGIKKIDTLGKFLNNEENDSNTLKTLVSTKIAQDKKSSGENEDEMQKKIINVEKIYTFFKHYIKMLGFEVVKTESDTSTIIKIIPGFTRSNIENKLKSSNPNLDEGVMKSLIEVIEKIIRLVEKNQKFGGNKEDETVLYFNNMNLDNDDINPDIIKNVSNEVLTHGLFDSQELVLKDKLTILLKNNDLTDENIFKLIPKHIMFFQNLLKKYGSDDDNEKGGAGDSITKSFDNILENFEKNNNTTNKNKSAEDIVISKDNLTYYQNKINSDFSKKTNIIDVAFNVGNSNNITRKLLDSIYSDTSMLTKVYGVKFDPWFYKIIRKMDLDEIVLYNYIYTYYTILQYIKNFVKFMKYGLNLDTKDIEIHGSRFAKFTNIISNRLERINQNFKSFYEERDRRIIKNNSNFSDVEYKGILKNSLKQNIEFFQTDLEKFYNEILEKVDNQQPLTNKELYGLRRLLISDDDFFREEEDEEENEE